LLQFIEPSERLGEILFGLIMVLTFTLGAGLEVQEGPEAARQLLIAAIGCNLAWGIIDGVMYVMNAMSERGRRQRLVRAVKQAPDRDTGLSIVRGELAPAVEPFAGEALREQLYVEALARVQALPLRRNRVGREDLLGGLACFVLVFFSALPAALPFLVVEDAWIALRMSNALLLAGLFATGWRWAHFTGGSPIATASAMLAIGVALVVVALALGG
jgi:VIT1/CCC1 family predicted Fe2+/Mn2+ transporter